MKLSTGLKITKHFCPMEINWLMFIPGNFYQSSLMFSSKARAHPSEALYMKLLVWLIAQNYPEESHQLQTL